ncbi:MAG: SgcJ/EcaC family oxidoreductase [Roseinatronobacter sp.]
MPHITDTELEISSLFDIWNSALQTGDSRAVGALYADDATLIPTLSNEIRQTPAAIESYFTKFMTLLPKASILHQTIRRFAAIAINSGIYSFETTVDGAVHVLVARFTFVYRKDGDTWKIIEHHSSAMPET